jgi:hypothetical protein
MRISRFAKSVLIFVAISVILAVPASAIDGALNLPSTIVDIEVSDGTQSYFDTLLSEVPSGYDVTNATYLGWCVDSRTTMSRSPATHEVRLFSSIDPPAELADQKWDMVNYILNHKRGVMSDVQQAIWYFIIFDGNYTPTRSVAWEIVNETLQNGEGYIPVEGQTVAVICYPLIYSHQTDVQVSIIEVESSIVIPEFPSALVLTPIMLTISLAVLVSTRKRKAPR